MDFFINIFNVTLYQPLFNALILLYLYLPGQDFGIAVIILTILIKLALYPISAKGILAQKALQEIQPKIKEIQENFKNDKEKQVRAVMDFYKKEKINPFSGILPLLVQLPILIGMFRVFWKGFEPERFEWLYSFVQHPGQIDATFLGFVNLAEASIVLAFIAGILQFVQTKMITPSKNQSSPVKKPGQPDFAQMMQKQMLYFFPVFTVMILWHLPAAIALYWITTTVFTVCQQYITLKNHNANKS